MPKQIVSQITFMCPTGLGNPNASCRFHRASDNLTRDECCPNHDFICPDKNCNFYCGLDNAPRDSQGIMICYFHGIPLIGNKGQSLRPKLVKSTDPLDKITMTVMGEEDIETEIEREDEERGNKGTAKRTEAEKIAHRVKRKDDIVRAIAKAKLLEDI